MKNALIAVDCQRDFMPGGALAVPQGDEVIPVINRLAAEGRWDLVIATQDWHRSYSPEFVTNGGPWPVHCLGGSPGAELHPDLEIGRRVRASSDETTCRYHLIRKESYSAFTGTGLGQLLDERGIEHVVICGLAFDYCVSATALHVGAGAATTVVSDATRAVGGLPAIAQTAICLHKSGVRIATSDEVLAEMAAQEKRETAKAICAAQHQRVVRAGR